VPFQGSQKGPTLTHFTPNEIRNKISHIPA
jgi:hypothetical protein